MRNKSEVAAVTAPMDAAGVARWREAGQRIVQDLERRHPDPWFRLPKEEFLRRVKALDQDLENLNERQVVLHWKLIFAALGDEHTDLWEQSTGTKLWPLLVRIVPSGVYITSAGQGFEDVLGGRILKVDGQPVQAYIEALKPFSAAAVPSHGTARAAERFPFGWIWLKETGRLPPEFNAAIEVEAADGHLERREVPLLDRTEVRWANLKPAAALLRDIDPQRFYAYRLIEEGRTLYIRYRSCRNQPGQDTVWAFTGKVQQAAKSASVERAIVDLRGNRGGNSLLFWRMERWIRRHPAFSRPGGLLLLTDSSTFSSAFMAARNLQSAGGTVLGSEPGQALNHFGQIRFTELAGLRPSFACSTKTFRFEPGDPTAWTRSLRVDVPLAESGQDVLGLTDSVLSAALRTPFPGK